MKKISKLKNVIQEYAWGSVSAIPELLGMSEPDSIPRAELWMGAHPKAPFQVYIHDRWVSLQEEISKHPEDILGEKTTLKFGNRLPYLFKILAADKPLSTSAWKTQWDALVDKVDQAWQGDQSALETLTEMRR